MPGSCNEHSSEVGKPCSGNINACKSSCKGSADGTITTSITGSVATVKYHWSNGATTQSLSGLVAGAYTVTITDSTSATVKCTTTFSTTVTEPTTALSVGITTTGQDCSGAATGSATAAGAGGNGGYTYVWSTGATTATISNLPAGTYAVTVTDSKNCTAINSVTLTNPAFAYSKPERNQPIM